MANTISYAKMYINNQQEHLGMFERNLLCADLLVRPVNITGKTISYGRTYKCPKDTDIAVLPIGYADGFLRRYSPGATVTINGKNYPVCGRICMDQCMVDIGKNNKDVHLWDKVMIFGPKESGALNTADDLAKLGNTISYEVLTSISKRVYRDIR